MSRPHDKLTNFQNHNKSFLCLDDNCEDEMIAATIIPSQKNESDEESGQRESVLAKTEIMEEMKQVQESPTSMRKSVLISEENQYRATFGFGSRVQSSRNASVVVASPDPVDQQVTVVATLVTSDRDDNSFLQRKKTIDTQKILILVCILLCIIIAAMSFMFDMSGKDNESVPSNGHIDDSISEDPSQNPSNSPSASKVFSSSPSTVSSPSIISPIGSQNWKLGTQADIGVGPGSYYTSNPNISIQNEQITNEVEAMAYIQSMNSKHPQNPIIMWMIEPPTSQFEGLLAHRLLYLSQNLDASSGKDASGIVQDSIDFLQIHGKEGGDVYYLEDISWRIRETCDIGIGIGSYFADDSSISIHENNINTEEEGYAFTELFNLKHTNNPIIMWEISWATGSYRAHRLNFFSDVAAGKDYTNSEDFLNDAVDFIEQTNREEHKSNNVFYSIA